MQLQLQQQHVSKPDVCCLVPYICVMQFPYYTFVDRSKMYTVGSLFYAIYFFVSFPMFMRIEEDPKGRKWSLGEVSLVKCTEFVVLFVCLNAVLDMYCLACAGSSSSSSSRRVLTHGPLRTLPALRRWRWMRQQQACSSRCC